MSRPKHARTSGTKTPIVKQYERERRRYWEPEHKVVGGIWDEFKKKLDGMGRTQAVNLGDDSPEGDERVQTTPKA